MEKNKKRSTPPKSIKDKIKEMEKAIVALCNDSHHATSMLNELLRLQKASDEMNMELSIPISEVKESIDYPAYSVKRTTRGILFSCKGGLHTFVESRMTATYQMLMRLFELELNKDNISDDMKEYVDAYKDSVAYIMQTPIFASMGEESLYSIATAILSTFNKYVEENYTNAKIHKENEQDIDENNEMERVNAAVKTLVDLPDTSA